MLVEELRAHIPSSVQIQIRNKQGYILLLGKNGAADITLDKISVKELRPITIFDTATGRIVPVIQIEV